MDWHCTGRGACNGGGGVSVTEPYVQRELAEVLGWLEKAFTAGKLKGLALVAVNDEGGFRQSVVFAGGAKITLLGAIQILNLNATRMVADHPENDGVSEYHDA